MPPLPPAPPMPAAPDQALLLEESRRLVELSPRLAFEKAALLRDELLRERTRREAYLAMTRRQPKDAAALVGEVIAARWLPEVHFAQALDVAVFLVKEQPAMARRLLVATARRHPAVALREARQYIELPYGREIRDAAQAASGGEAPDVALLRLRQNGGNPAPEEALRLAALAATEEERETAIALLRRLAWESSELKNVPPDTLRGALALLADSGPLTGVPEELVRRALTGFEESEDPLAEAVKIATILPAAPAGVAASLPDTKLGRLLRRPRAGGESLAAGDLFRGGLCVQRYLFYNDDDGVESFESFLKAYAGDPKWSVERHDGWVHLRGRAEAGRRIEIFANEPVDLQLPVNGAIAGAVGARQDAVTRAMRERKVEATMIVHRGHDHHFESSRRLLHSEARLVFLGSCRGMANVETVVTRCRRAQMIATRGIGNTAVNDTFLRALNRKLLEGGERLDWEAFWAELRPALGSNSHFQEYVPPHRNAAALFLADWYREALSAP